MSEKPGDLYSQREERPSLAGEVEQSHKMATSAFGRSLRGQMQALRRRRIWLHRIAVGAIVVYVLGLTIFIPVIMFRKPARLAEPAPLSTAPAKFSTPAVTPAVTTNSAKVFTAAVNPVEGRLAVQKLKEALERLREARSWMQKGRSDTARTLLQKVLNDNPDNSEVRFELAQITFEQGVKDYTRELLQQVLRADPKHKAARQMLATTYLQLEQYESALALAQWILEGDPASMEAHHIAGLAHLKLGHLEQAGIHFRRWVALDPDNTDALKLYADTLMSLQDYAKAANLYEDILKKKALEAEAYRQLAICYAKQTQVDKTVATLTQALALLGAPQVMTWFKDPGFDSVREHSLFTTLERNTTRPVLGLKSPQAGETAIDMNSVLDPKRMQQVQGMLNRQE